jgi:hypothetical protein
MLNVVLPFCLENSSTPTERAFLVARNMGFEFDTQILRGEPTKHKENRATRSLFYFIDIDTVRYLVVTWAFDLSCRICAVILPVILTNCFTLLPWSGKKTPVPAWNTGAAATRRGSNHPLHQHASWQLLDDSTHSFPHDHECFRDSPV